jgi:hypothetical protein
MFHRAKHFHGQWQLLDDYRLQTTIDAGGCGKQTDVTNRNLPASFVGFYICRNKSEAVTCETLIGQLPQLHAGIP